jgi:hypothetical protein
MEIDVHHELARVRTHPQLPYPLLQGQGLDEVVADEMAVLPGWRSCSPC